MKSIAWRNMLNLKLFFVHVQLFNQRLNGNTWSKSIPAPRSLPCCPTKRFVSFWLRWVNQTSMRRWHCETLHHRWRSGEVSEIKWWCGCCCHWDTLVIHPKLISDVFHLELPSLQPSDGARQMWCLTHPSWKEMKMTRRRPKDDNEQANFPISGKSRLCLWMTCWGWRWRWRACRGHKSCFGSWVRNIWAYAHYISSCNDNDLYYIMIMIMAILYTIYIMMMLINDNMTILSSYVKLTLAGRAADASA